MSLELILGRRLTHTRSMGFASRKAPDTGELLTYSGEGHLMTFAPTGTGKTSGPVISNALSHKGQLIVLDIKGEIYDKTAQARRDMGQEVHVLDLRDSGIPGALNPLDSVALTGADPAAMGRSLAAEMIERSPDERDRFWNDWAETMLTGGIAYLLSGAPDEQRRLSWLFDLFSLDDADYKVAKLLDDEGEKMHRATKAAFGSYLQLPDQSSRPSVLGSTVTHLRLFDSDLVRRLTDTSTMDVSRLVAGEPMSLYIIVPPMRLTAFWPLLRCWLSGLILAMTQRGEPPKERTLLLCDEAGNLGRIDALFTATTLLRSWGVTLWTLWQNVAQLQHYGAFANTLIDNAGVIQIFGARNQRMAQDLANIVGGLSGEQIMALGPEEQVLLIEGKLIRCKQARYYSDQLFKG